MSKGLGTREILRKYNMQSNLLILIEAILYWKGESVAEKELAKMLEATPEAVAEALAALESSLSARGVRLMRHNGDVSLVTAPEASDLLEKIRKEELSKDLGKAALETLAIVLYQGPATRADIEYVRGVNCTSILRSLQIRGLIEKFQNPKDQRSSLYRVTEEMLRHLGITSLPSFPRYAEARAELAAFSAKLEEENETEVPADIPEHEKQT
jgi:segregation and condensation protein B